MSKQKVVHVMREPYDVAVDRSGKWGNIYSHKSGTQAPYTVNTREEAVQKYREYILNNQELLNSLHELDGQTLGCWCAGPNGLTTDDKPYRCHGQVILELIEARHEQSNT